MSMELRYCYFKESFENQLPDWVIEEIWNKTGAYPTQQMYRRGEIAIALIERPKWVVDYHTRLLFDKEWMTEKNGHPVYINLGEKECLVYVDVDKLNRSSKYVKDYWEWN